MKLHRWSRTLDLVPEWMWWAHIVLSAVAALTLAVKFDLPTWLAITTFFAGTALLTAGLFHPISAVIVALLGGALCIGVSSIVLGALFALALRHLLDRDLALYASLGLGALAGLAIAIASYRPFLVRLRTR